MKWFRRERTPTPGVSPARPVPSGGAPARRIDWRSWDPIAADYERVVAPNTAQVYPLLLDAAEVKSGARVLDVGCGTGSGLTAVAERGAHAFGCDPSVGMLRAGKNVRPSTGLVAADT